MPNTTTGYSIISDSKLDAIADAIKAKDASAVLPMTADQMAAAIAAIPTGGDVESIVGQLAGGTYSENDPLRVKSGVIKQYFFQSVGGLSAVEMEFPQGATSYECLIQNNAFSNAVNLESFTVDPLTTFVEVGKSAFHNTKLLSVSMPIKYIGQRAFNACTYMTKFISTYAPSSASDYLEFHDRSYTQNWAFGNCSALRVVDMLAAPSFQYATFENCTSLEAIVIRDTDKIGILAQDTFYGCTPIANKTCKIYVPDALQASYQQGTNWASYQDIILPLSQYVDPTL